MSARVNLKHLMTSRDQDDLLDAVRELCGAFDLTYWEACDSDHPISSRVLRRICVCWVSQHDGPRGVWRGVSNAGSNLYGV